MELVVGKTVSIGKEQSLAAKMPSMGTARTVRTMSGALEPLSDNWLTVCINLALHSLQSLKRALCTSVHFMTSTTTGASVRLPFNPCSKWVATNVDMENGCLAMDVLELSSLARTVSTGKCLVSSVNAPTPYNLLCSERFNKREPALQRSNKRHSVGAASVISLSGFDKGGQRVLAGHGNTWMGLLRSGRLSSRSTVEFRIRSIRPQIWR